MAEHNASQRQPQFAANNNKQTKRRSKGRVSVSGPWLAFPLDFLASRACNELSPHGIKMLIDLCAQMRAGGRGNGDLSAAPAIMRPKGWASDATRSAALKELEAAGIISITRHGDRKRCALYAITLWPLDCDFSKLEHGPGSYSTSDWQATPDRRERPTLDAPAKWGRPRKTEKAPVENANSHPAAGQPAGVIGPPRDNQPSPPMVYEPGAGSKLAFLGRLVIPPGETYLDNHLHSTAGACTPHPEPEFA